MSKDQELFDKLVQAAYRAQLAARALILKDCIEYPPEWVKTYLN